MRPNIIPWISRRYILTDVSCCSCLSVWMLQYWCHDPVFCIMETTGRFLYWWPTVRTTVAIIIRFEPIYIWNDWHVSSPISYLGASKAAKRWEMEKGGGENRSRGDSGFVQASGMSISVNPHAPALLLQLIICPAAAVSLHNNILCAVIYSWLVPFPTYLMMHTARAQY